MADEYCLTVSLTGETLENEVNFKLYFDSREKLLGSPVTVGKLVKPLLGLLEEYQREHPDATDADIAEANEIMRGWCKKPDVE